MTKNWRNQEAAVLKKQQQKNHLQPQVVFQCWRKPIFPGRHQPSIFGAGELNFRVRDGNGWTLAAINTNYFVFAVSLDGFIMIPHHFENCKPFFQFFSKKFFGLEKRWKPALGRIVLRSCSRRENGATKPLGNRPASPQMGTPAKGAAGSLS